MDGKILLTIDPPADLPAYKNSKAFVPTETTVLPNGDFYIADGYGAQHILHYDENGKLKNAFGGRGTKDENLDNAHGITVDTRTGTTYSCKMWLSEDKQTLNVRGYIGISIIGRTEKFTRYNK